MGFSPSRMSRGRRAGTWSERRPLTPLPWLQDALLWAMRNQLWGHALFLSSKMDPRTYSWVLAG